MSLEQAKTQTANVSPVFQTRFTDLQASAAATGKDLENSGLSKWFKLYSDGTKLLDGLLKDEKDKNFLGAFKRDDLNNDYTKAVLAKDGTVSYRSAQAAKVQLDLLAGLERETRMRYRTRVRMIAHAAARMQSHGLGEGPIQKGIMNFVTLLADRK